MSYVIVKNGLFHLMELFMEKWKNEATLSTSKREEGMLVLWVEGLTGLGITSICCHKPCEQSQLTDRCDQQGPSESYRTRAVSPQAWVR